MPEGELRGPDPEATESIPPAALKTLDIKPERETIVPRSETPSPVEKKLETTTKVDYGKLIAAGKDLNEMKLAGLDVDAALEALNSALKEGGFHDPQKGILPGAEVEISKDALKLIRETVAEGKAAEAEAKTVEVPASKQPTVAPAPAKKPDEKKGWFGRLFG